ncbi:MAG: RNA polymerase [Planctomycetota bacterium]|nr:MAG: RNA polymerase [Planctomycetota bacterium]
MNPRAPKRRRDYAELEFNMTEAASIPSDQQLLAKVVERDLEAFGELYDRHSPRLLGLLRVMVRHLSDAEDLLQEVFAQVWDRAHSYNPDRGRPVVWLVLLTRSRALDFLRSKNRRPEAFSVEENALPLELQDAASEAEIDEEAALVRRALTRLPEEQSEALQLSFFHGFSHVQIAQNHGIPLGTVKTRIRLGMSRLRDLLQQIKESA